MLLRETLSTTARIADLKRSKKQARLAVTIALALTTVAALSCGKRKPPLPPRERVEQRAEIGGFQRGNQVILSWRMPARNAPDGSVLNIDRVDVYRLAEPLTAPQTMSEEEFSSQSLIIASIAVRDTDFGLKPMSYRDELQFAGQAVRLRYAVRFVNRSGQKAAFSNFYLMEPAARVAAMPTSLSVQVTQEAIRLVWLQPLENVDGTTPANIIGYNVYRSAGETEPGQLLNRQTLPDASFADTDFEFGKRYFYFVRTVSQGTGGDPIESLESNIVSVEPVDTFAPSAPSSITIAATPTTVSIFFPSNPENDIAGYRIYRSTDRDRPLGEWELLTPELRETTTFQDAQVESGRTYHYYIVAVDRFGNSSQPSEVVSETIP